LFDHTTPPVADLSKGQRAILVALAYPEPGNRWRSDLVGLALPPTLFLPGRGRKTRVIKKPDFPTLAEQGEKSKSDERINPAALSQARAIVKWCPEYVEDIRRRHLNAGQQAMRLALLYPEPEKGGRGHKTKALETSGFSRQRLGQARAVVAFSRELAFAGAFTM
jgi:hypothetical protein